MRSGSLRRIGNALLTVLARAMNCQPEADCEYHKPDDGWSEVRETQVTDRRMHANGCPEPRDSSNRQRLPESPRCATVPQARKHRYGKTC